MRMRWQPSAIVAALVACSAGPSGSKALLRPYIRTLIEVRADEFDSTGRFKTPSPKEPLADTLFDRILHDRTPAGDSAVAYLLFIYAGEAPGEETVCEAAARGTRMRPIIEAYSRSLPSIGLEPLPKMMISTGILVPDALARIGKKEICDYQ